MVVGEYFEFGVEVEVQEDEACKCCGCVTRWHGLEAVVDLLFVSRADATVKHDLTISVGNVSIDTCLDAVVVLAET